MLNDSSEPPLRERTRALDERQRKILTALVAHFVEHPTRVREQEWVSEQYVQIVLVAFDFENDHELPGVQEGIEKVRNYARDHANSLIPLALGVFGEMAQTLQQRGGAITPESVTAELLTYVQGE